MRKIGLVILTALIYLGCEKKHKSSKNNNAEYYNLSAEIGKKTDSIKNINKLIINNPINQQDLNKNDSIARKISSITDNIINELVESYGKTPTDTILNILNRLDNSGYIPNRLYHKLTKKDFSTGFGQRARKQYQIYLETINEKQKSLKNVNLLVKEFSLYRLVENDTILLRDLLVSHNGYKVLDFWATWCAPCRSFNKKFQDKYKKYRDKGVKFYGIGIRVDSKGEKEKFLIAVENDKTPWKQFIDFDNKVYNLFNTNAVPFQVLLDEKNQIIKILSHDIIDKELDEVLD